jgi:hypothetical protein
MMKVFPKEQLTSDFCNEEYERDADRNRQPRRPRDIPHYTALRHQAISFPKILDCCKVLLWQQDGSLAECRDEVRDEATANMHRESLVGPTKIRT